MFNSRQEPFVVIGACVVHGDNQLGKLEEALRTIKEQHIPKDDWSNFVFHATEIYSGTKYFRNRDLWTWEKRKNILLDLASIPKALNIPLLYGFVDRLSGSAPPIAQELEPRDLEIGLFCGAYLELIIRLENAMRQLFPDEITLIIGEENTSVQVAAKNIHNSMRDSDFVDREWSEFSHLFPLQGIKEEVHFSTKKGSNALQLADFANFFIKKRLVKDQRARPIWNKIKDALIYPIQD